MSVFFKDTWAKLWDVKPAEKYTDLRITTSEKDKEGNYVNSTWFPRVFGSVADQFKKMQQGDRFKITSGKIANVPYKLEDGKIRSRLEFRIFSIDAGSSGGGDQKANPVDGSDNDMPY